MTATPETLFVCDRCGDTVHVGARNTVPEPQRPATPEGWLVLRIGTDPTTPQSHLCSACAFGFNAYMADRTLSVAGPLLEWTCGHTAGSHCAQCYAELAGKAHQLQEEIDELREVPPNA
jgi:hypothetical protein